MLGIHILLLLLIPLVWHMIKHSSIQWPRPAGAEALGSPLSDVEQQYYESIFSYTMQNIAANKSYGWKVGRSFGKIRVGQSFVSQSQSLCRPYAESYSINGVSGSAEGYACRRTVDDDDAPSWCRLRQGEALTCAMEKRGFMDTVFR